MTGQVVIALADVGISEGGKKLAKLSRRINFSAGTHFNGLRREPSSSRWGAVACATPEVGTLYEPRGNGCAEETEATDDYG